MSGADGQEGTETARIAAMEDRLAATLMTTAHEVAHAECFDSEQRAEVYAILETLKANTETHRAMIELLARKIKERQGDA